MHNSNEVVFKKLIELFDLDNGIDFVFVNNSYGMLSTLRKIYNFDKDKISLYNNILRIAK